MVSKNAKDLENETMRHTEGDVADEDTATLAWRHVVCLQEEVEEEATVEEVEEASMTVALRCDQKIARPQILR